MRLLPLALLPLALAVAGCNGNSGRGICGCDATTEVCLSGRCFPITQQPPATVPEPAATPATCGAFQQKVGDAIATPEPPAGGPCATTVQASGTPATTLELGDLKVGTSVPFQLPAGASSFTIVMQAVSAVPQIALSTATATTTLDNTAVPLIVTAPDGSTWYDDMQPLAADGSTQLVFFASNSPGVGSLSVPNTTKSLQVVDTTGLPSGTWTFTVSDYAWECFSETALASQCGAGVAGTTNFAKYKDGLYRVAVNLNVAARPAQGTLNVGLYLHACPGANYDTNGACTDPHPLTAANALTDPDAKRFVQTLATLLANGGLCLGQVTWYDLPAWAQTKWKAGLDLDATTCDAQLGELLSLSQPIAGGQMNLFLVPEILAAPPPGSTSKAVIVGIDGSIPGSGTFSGTVQSGAAVSAANLRSFPSACTGALALANRCGADVTAYIAAHETGHFLGLYHTTESAGADFDPIADTFQCQCRTCLTGTLASQCGTAGAEVTASSCVQSTTTCGGGRNLMFWLLDNTVSQGSVSPQQSDVMRSSPLVR